MGLVKEGRAGAVRPVIEGLIACLVQYCANEPLKRPRARAREGCTISDWHKGYRCYCCHYCHCYRGWLAGTIKPRRALLDDYWRDSSGEAFWGTVEI
jgi:hypothetical protein